MRWMPLLALFMIAITGCHQATDPPRQPETAFLSDGCSCFPDLDHGDCCVEHDRAYWRGGSPDQRRAADEALQQCIAAKGRPHLARAMYWGVRIGGHGWLPTPWRWGFGHRWPEGYF